MIEKEEIKILDLDKQLNKNILNIMIFKQFFEELFIMNP